jgi:trimeric autotransporter adhesin
MPKSTTLPAPYSGAVFVFERDGRDWAQAAYLKASNPSPGDQFGESVALFGDTLVVGAIGEQSSATEVDGDESDDTLYAAGAAYVFTADDAGRFRQTAYLKPTNTREELRFGSAVGVNADTIAVGAFTEQSGASGIDGDPMDTTLDESGAVYLFTLDGDRYVQSTYVKASNPGVMDRFGQRLVLRGDALIVGANGEASADRGVNAPQNNDSAQAAGAAYVYFRDTSGTWTERAYLKASNAETGDNFSFGLGFDGVTLVAGAPFEDNAKGGLDMEPSPNNALQSAGAIYVFR